MFFHPEFRYLNPADIDKIINAEIPNPKIGPVLYNIAASVMIHGPCERGFNIKSPCMLNGKCFRYFPKKCFEMTTIDHDGYPVYRRRDNIGRFIQKGDRRIDNRFVVPYNRYLLLK